MQVVQVPQSVWQKIIVTLEVIQANTSMKKDVYVNEEQAQAITGYSARKLLTLRSKQAVKWTSNDAGREVKYSYQSLLKLIS